ncbi:MAG: L-rhamnose mutarotase [Puniceicoccaceae bacterium]
MPDEGQPRVRKLYRRRLDPGKVGTYCDYHRSISAELESLYREHGLTSISSFLLGNDLCVLVEYDPVIYDRMGTQLDQHPLEKEWQSRMAELNAPGAETLEYTEVYRMTEEPTRE